MYADGIEEILRKLQEFPKIGAAFNDVLPPLRAITYRSHKLYYDFDGSIVTIVRVLHQASDAATQLRSS